jgi:hypothetical protein
MGLDIRKEAEEIRSMYQTANTSKYFRCLVFGDVGTGKTKLLETCPKPIHVDSFDVGGTTTIRKAIEEGWILADTRYEDEDPDKPGVMALYDKEFDRRRLNGYFENIGTYALDSLTTFGDAAMNYILNKHGRKDGIPMSGKGSDNDYVKQQKVIEPILRSILNLPCHVIILAHPDMRENEDTRTKSIGPKVYGQLATKLPLLLSEIYCATTKETKDGIDYRLLTRQNGYYRCRSRLASNGKIEMYEAQDIKAILAKAGFDNNDKDMTWLK